VTKARDLSVGIPNGLVLIKPTGATNGTVNDSGTVTIGSAVASVTVSGAFSATYDNYLLIFAGLDQSTSSQSQLKYNNSTGATYSWAGNYQNYAGSNLLAASVGNTVHVISINGGNATISAVVNIQSPFLAKRTTHQSSYSNLAFLGNLNGYDNNAVSQTGFTYQHDAGTITGGTIRVYGYQN